MLQVNQLVGFGAGGRGVISYQFTDSDSQNPGALQTTWTFTNKAIGTAAANRYVLVSLFSPGTGQTLTATSVTVGGISATNVLDARFWLAPVPTGTTATIVVTLSANQNFFGIGVYSITGQLNTTPFHTQTTQAVNSDPSINLNVDAGGLIICQDTTSGDTAAPTLAWTGATENFEFGRNQPVGGSHENSGASAGVFATAQTVNISVTRSGGNGTPVSRLVGVSFAPL